MKRILWSLVLLLFTAPLLSAQTLATHPGVQAPVVQGPPPPPPNRLAVTGPSQPVYIYLYSRITDHVNLDITEARLRRLLPMIEKYRKEHPEAHVSATILFSGATSEALAHRNAKTGIKDFVLKYKKLGIIEIGYDGTDEPTYEHRPMVRMIDAKTYQERWLERASEDEKFLTEGRDPLTGDPAPGTVGGLKAMQQVFGEAACITGVSVGEESRPPVMMANQQGPPLPANMPGTGATPGVKPEVGDWEVVPLLRRYNTEAIMFGLPGSNPAHVPGFGGSINGMGGVISPVPQASPELFWEDNVLRTSESGGRGARVIHGDEGPAAIQGFTAKLDRSEIRVIHMELDNESDYLKPDFAKSAPLSAALTYAYAHPDNPKLPAEDRLSEDEVNGAYAKDEASLNWVVTNIFNAKPGGRFVSSSDLKRMTPASTGYTISVDALRAAVKDELAKWGNNTFPPSYFQVGHHYLSLAETFQVLTDALAELNRTGRLPQTVTVDRVYGPIGMPLGHGPNVGDVKVASVAKVCAQIAPGLHDDTGYPMPKNTVPPLLTVDGIGVNAAQFLRLMAQAVADPTTQAPLRVRMTYMFTEISGLFPKMRTMQDLGATWTVKPAPLETSGSTQATQDRGLSQPRQHADSL
jgi:hypothetical protein